MKDRAQHVAATRDFNRPYRDIVDRHRQWTMEEWIHFAEAWSPYILSAHPKIPGGHVLHDPRLREMWGLLRAVTLHYCRATPGSGSPAKQREAHDKLMEYARMVSQHFGIKACTYNLHLLCCRYIPASMLQKTLEGSMYCIDTSTLATDLCSVHMYSNSKRGRH